MVDFRRRSYRTPAIRIRSGPGISIFEFRIYFR